MNLQQQVDESRAAIAAIQQEIYVAKQKVEKTEQQLEKAIAEGRLTAPFEKLLESATAELTSLRHKEVKFLEEKNTLLSKLPMINPSASNESLDFSVASYDSCRSQSKSGNCATGRHVNRLKNPMKKMRRALLRRDKCCVATGEQDHSNLTAAHIVPLNESQRIPREQHYSPQNGVLLRKDLEQSYDLFQWIFDADGRVFVLYEHWIHRNDIKQLNLSSDPTTRPSADLIQIHNELARSRKPECCPNCWKFVGRSNIESHQKGSCEALGFVDDENMDSADDDDDDDDEQLSDQYM